MIPTVIYRPEQLGGQNPPPLEQYGYRLLAEGDSWFTIGALNPLKNANLLNPIAFRRSSCVVSCAYPGDTLRHMADLQHNDDFSGLLTGAVKRSWDGILISAGGNDLIDAAQVPPTEPDAAKRLLLTAAEWGPAASGAIRYLSAAGWATFRGYLIENYRLLVAARDGPDSDSRGAPIFTHTYAFPTPRDAPAGPGVGPWLAPALRAYGIPEQDWNACADELIGRLADLLVEIGSRSAEFPNVHVFDSVAMVPPIVRAAPGTTGVDGEWANEIHLTRKGCAKLSAAWCAAIEPLLPGGA
jgi:hypothetical protein